MPTTSSLQSSVRQSSAWSKLLVAGMIQPEEVARILRAAEVRFVLAGAHAMNAWTGRIRATMDVDIVVEARHHKKAVRAVRAAFPHLRERDTEVVTRFSDRETGQIAIDLMKPKDDLLRTVLSEGHVRRISLAGEKLLIPDLEAAVAMRFAAMLSAYRQRADKLQDAADFARVIEANPRIQLGRLEALGERVYRGGGREVLRLVSAIREGEPLVF
ncbi:MAG: hypothetical protein HYY18_06755 [Planctomycetes bacterium]|nr:hypothetical protein [Planctomycetota bacterium]